MKYVMVLAALLTGCALEGVYPDEPVGVFRAECNGGFNDFGSCIIQAQEKCGSAGYDSLERSNNIAFARRSLRFKCKGKP